MKKRCAVIFALVLAAATSLMPAAQAVDVSYQQVELTAEVSGSSVIARTTVWASSSVAAQFYGVCVRSSSDDNLDFHKRAATITTAGTSYVSLPKSFAAGTYTYFSCLFDDDGWHNVGATQTFTVDEPDGPQPDSHSTVHGCSVVGGY